MFTLGAVIRSESVFKVDLSDLMDFTFHQENEPDPYHVLIMRIGFGKTVKGDNPIYARELRHRDARAKIWCRYFQQIRVSLYLPNDNDVLFRTKLYIKLDDMIIHI